MDLSEIPLSELQAFRSNFTVAEDRQEHLLRCWRHQNCRGCLASSECSWCPFSWSCVPNSYKVPLLAPAYEENICPHWAERWEIRTQPFGCQVSTITSLTSIVSIVSTLLAVLFLSLFVVGILRLRRHTRDKPLWGADWRQRQWARLTRRTADGERDPLLPREA